MIALMFGIVAATLPIVWATGASARRGAPQHQIAPKHQIAPRTPIVVVAAVAAVVFAPVLGFLGIVLWLLARPLRVWARSLQVDRSRAAAIPDGLEIIAMAISAGMSIPGMLRLLASCGPLPLRPLFTAARQSLAVGRSHREVLHQLASAGGSQLAAVTEVLIAADRDGASVALVLDRLATEAGRARRLAAEEKARRAPVLMLAPLTLCSLPAVLIGTVLPFVLLSFGQTSL